MCDFVVHDIRQWRAHAEKEAGTVFYLFIFFIFFFGGVHVCVYVSMFLFACLCVCLFVFMMVFMHICLSVFTHCYPGFVYKAI